MDITCLNENRGLVKDLRIGVFVPSKSRGWRNTRISFFNNPDATRPSRRHENLPKKTTKPIDQSLQPRRSASQTRELLTARWWPCRTSLKCWRVMPVRMLAVDLSGFVRYYWGYNRGIIWYNNRIYILYYIILNYMYILLYYHIYYRYDIYIYCIYRHIYYIYIYIINIINIMNIIYYIVYITYIVYILYILYIYILYIYIYCIYYIYFI